MKILLSKAALGALSLSAFAVGASLYAASIFDIQYPIPELGNCANGPACKAYCNVADHEQACENFAAEHGVVTAIKHQDDVKNLMTDGGPGQCAAGAANPEASCKAYCDNQSHMKECVMYGKDHGLLAGEELTRAEKVIKAIDSGAKLPAGCTDQASCKQTCEDPKDLDTAKQCFAFAEQAGLLPPGVDKNRAEKTFELIAAGKAPFKSIKDFKQCDNPSSEEILQKCVSFAADNGLMSPQEAQIVRETGGKGPGGCMGKTQCDAYCENHQDECFQFAQEHNLIGPEDKMRMEQGAQMLKQSYEHAPPEVKQCLSQNVGDDILNQIMSGQKPPSPQIGDAMRSCFESAFRDHPGEGMMQGDASSTMMGRPGTDGMGRQDEGRFPGQGGGQDMGMPPQAKFSPEVEACIVSKVGEEGLNKIKYPSGQPDQALGAVIRGCFKQIEGERTGPGGCTTAEECKQYCGDPAHAAECGAPAGGGSGNGGDGILPGGMMRPRDYQDHGEGSSTGPTGGPQNWSRPHQNGDEQRMYQNMPPQRMPYPGTQMQDGQYPPQYTPPPGQYPSGETPPPGASTQPPPPPQTSFLFGVKNFASVIFSFFAGR